MPTTSFHVARHRRAVSSYDQPSRASLTYQDGFNHRRVSVSDLPVPVEVRASESAADRDVYLNGLHDGSWGSVEELGHLYRVDERLITTDSVGFSCTFVYADEATATRALYLIGAYWSQQGYDDSEAPDPS